MSSQTAPHDQLQTEPSVVESQHAEAPKDSREEAEPSAEQTAPEGTTKTDVPFDSSPAAVLEGAVALEEERKTGEAGEDEPPAKKSAEPPQDTDPDRFKRTLRPRKKVAY